MRIAILSSRKNVHTVRWSNEMASRGHEIHLISVHPGDENLHPGVTVHMLPVTSPTGYVRNWRPLRRLLSELKPELLHIHYVGGYGLLGLLSGYHPRIVSVWGSDVYEAPHKSPFHMWAITRTINTADWVCSTSEVMAVVTQELCPGLRHLTVVPFGVELARFSQRAEHSAESDQVIVGTVKSLYPKYGIDILINAFAEAKSQLLEMDGGKAPQLKLLIVGGGPEMQTLAELAQSRGIDASALVGPVPHTQVPEMMQQLDIYVAVSRADSESFGVAVVEASATCLPVVVSNVGGLPEVVEAGITGIIVPRENVPETAAAIMKLALDPALRTRMGHAGRQRVEERYDWTKNADQMEEIYVATARLGPGRLQSPLT